MIAGSSRGVCFKLCCLQHGLCTSVNDLFPPCLHLSHLFELSCDYPQAGLLCGMSRAWGVSQATGGAGLGAALGRHSATTRWTSQMWHANSLGLPRSEIIYCIDLLTSYKNCALTAVLSSTMLGCLAGRVMSACFSDIQDASDMLCSSHAQH